MPEGESSFMVEAVKGITNYYITSDRSTMSYRTRIRTPTFCALTAKCRQSLMVAWYLT